MSTHISNPKKIQSKSSVHTVTPLDHNEYRVVSGNSGNEYIVRLYPEESGAVCNCTWGKYRKYQDYYRSGCSHVVAVFDFIEATRNRKVSVWTDKNDADRQHKPKLAIGDEVILTSRRTSPKPSSKPVGYNPDWRDNVKLMRGAEDDEGID